jgi:hypothetical protein
MLLCQPRPPDMNNFNRSGFAAPSRNDQALLIGRRLCFLLFAAGEDAIDFGHEFPCLWVPRRGHQQATELCVGGHSTKSLLRKITREGFSGFICSEPKRQPSPASARSRQAMRQLRHGHHIVDPVPAKARRVGGSGATLKMANAGGRALSAARAVLANARAACGNVKIERSSDWHASPDRAWRTR